MEVLLCQYVWYNNWEFFKNGKENKVKAEEAVGELFRKEMERQGITSVDMEQRTGISDTTIRRILKGENGDLKLSQLAVIAKVLRISLWRVIHTAGLTDEVPETPGAEARRLAAVMEQDTELETLAQQMEKLWPDERDATAAYMDDLIRRRLNRQTPRQKRLHRQRANRRTPRS